MQLRRYFRNKQITMSYFFAMAVFVFHFRSAIASVTVTLPDGSPNYAGLCPHRDFCTTKAIKNITDQKESSCCQQCSCSPDCYDVGTCCPDMPSTDKREPKYACKDLYTFSSKNPDYDVGAFGISFRVVDDCPNKTMSLKYPGCENTTQLIDYIFVSDMMNERIYRNHQCAQCNGIETFVRWNADVSECSGFLNTMFSTIEERDQYVMANCIVTSLQPAADIGAMSRCLDNTALEIKNYCKYSTKNETISRLCEESIPSTSTIYLAKGAYRSLEYPNIFCYFCEVNEINFNAICPKFKFVLQKLGTVPFSTILSFSDPAPHSLGSDHQSCNLSMIWDPLDERCRPFYCPVGMIQTGLQCMPALKSDTGIVFTLHFIIETEQTFYGLDRNISSAVDLTLQKDMREHGMQCGICDREYFRSQNTNDSGLFVEFSVSSSEICSPNRILKWARYLFSQGTMHVQVKGEENPLIIILRLSSEPAINEAERVLVDFMLGNFCRRPIPLIDWMYLDCRFFRVNADSQSHVGLFSAKQTVGTLRKAVKMHNSSDVAICVDHYFSIHSAAAVDIMDTKHVISLLLLFIVFNH